MATPIGHALAGSIIGIGGSRGSGIDRRTLAWGTAGGLMPDLDFVPGLLVGDPARFHHGWSHSVGAAAVVGLLVWWLASDGNVRIAAIVFLAYASHVALDWATADPSVPVGVPALWPLLDAYVISPVMILPRVIHSSASPFNLHNLGVAAREVLLLGTPTLGLLWFRHRQGQSDMNTPPASAIRDSGGDGEEPGRAQ